MAPHAASLLLSPALCFQYTCTDRSLCLLVLMAVRPYDTATAISCLSSVVFGRPPRISFAFSTFFSQVPPTIIPLVQTHLADVLWFIGLELEADGNKPEQRKLYTSFIQQLMKKKLMGEELLLSRLENDVLQDVVRTTLAHRHDHSHHSTQHSLTHACIFSSYCCRAS